MRRHPRKISKATFERLSEFRYRLRRFERFSERVARAHGVTPLQYLMLLHIKGYPGREYANVGELAERLQAQPHSVVALINRGEKRGLVCRRASATDGREVQVHLLPEGEKLLADLAALHRSELESMPAILPLPLTED
jgi:DNA-binding MarR family transcriptional regulator